MPNSSRTQGSFPSLRSLYRDYIKGFPKSGICYSSDGTEWTECVKTYWARRGLNTGRVQVYAHGIPLTQRNFHGKEYMLDVVWRTSNRQTDRIQLALECEWNTQPKEKKYDFQKLVYIKAIQKVFLFQTRKTKDPLATVRELTRLIKQCSIRQEPKEQYLLISHTDDRSSDKLIEIVDGFIYSDGNLKQLPQHILRIPSR